jgi:hypothetical protein
MSTTTMDGTMAGGRAANEGATSAGVADEREGRGVARGGGLTLNGLLALGADELEALYRGARAPELAGIEGDLQGRMLSVVVLPGWVRPALRAFAGSRAFPWRGKSFRFLGGGGGEGLNRVFSDRISWLRWFRFTTAPGPSRAGGFEAVQLDYDHPENPWFIRAIKDEIREVRPGLYLGQAYLQAGGGARLVLYFALALPGREAA